MNSNKQNSRSRLIVGCGYLGQRVADRWLQSGSNVFAITRSSTNAKNLSAGGIHPTRGENPASTPFGYRDFGAW